MFAIIVLTIIIGASIASNANFDNDNVSGSYEGNFTFPEHYYFSLYANFDGEGHLDGNVTLIDENWNVAGSYRVMGEEIQGTFYFGAAQIVFIGIVRPNLIDGTASYYNGTENVNGTFAIV